MAEELPFTTYAPPASVLPLKLVRFEATCRVLPAFACSVPSFVMLPEPLTTRVFPTEFASSVPAASLPTVKPPLPIIP